jgi:hypothetical protein
MSIKTETNTIGRTIANSLPVVSSEGPLAVVVGRLGVVVVLVVGGVVEEGTAADTELVDNG